MWEPFSCSTPNHLSSWAEGVVRGHKRDLDMGASLTDVGLCNHYAVLSSDASSHPADAPLSPPDLEPPQSLVSADSAACPPNDMASVQITQPLKPTQCLKLGVSWDFPSWARGNCPDAELGVPPRVACNY
ncbi:hypothetical protein Q8A73_001665 [Channa argus]|nr:hypothetical protein Q8A73_001665 [Channa argus]